jgi:hypothetical protein
MFGRDRRQVTARFSRRAVAPLSERSLHRLLHRIGQKRPAILLAFVALRARLPVLSGTSETQRVVAGTLGEPPTRSRQNAYFRGLFRST